MNTNPQQYPTQFYGRTFVPWACALMFVPLAVFSCIMGPLFWLDIIKSANGAPGYTAGIPLTIIGLSFLLPFAIFFTFQIFAMQSPILTIYQEGLGIRAVGGIPVRSHPILIFTHIALFQEWLTLLWQLLTLQLFQIRTFYLRWKNINIVANAGTLEIGGLIDKNEYGFGQDTSLESEWHTTFFRVDSFGTPIAAVNESVQFFLHNPDARESLPSWQDEKTLLGNDTFDFR